MTYSAYEVKVENDRLKREREIVWCTNFVVLNYKIKRKIEEHKVLKKRERFFLLVKKERDLSLLVSTSVIECK